MKMWQKNKPYILLIPALVVTSVLVLGGMLQGVVESLKSYNGITEGNFTFQSYKVVLMSKEFWDSFFLTFRISIISTVLSAILGMAVILCLFNVRINGNLKVASLFKRIFHIPMLFPYIVGAYVVFLVLTQGGWLSSIVYSMGIISKINHFPIIVNDKFGWGIILTYVWKTSPFIVIMLYPTLLKVESSWLEVGRVFGAGFFDFFKEVVFMMLLKPLITSSLIVFAFVFSAFEVPYLLGITYPKMLSVYSYEMYTSGQIHNRPIALAINVIITIVVILIGIVFYKLYSKPWNKGE